MTEVAALILLPQELELIARALGELHEREGVSEIGADVLEMVAGALHPEALVAYEDWLT